MENATLHDRDAVIAEDATRIAASRAELHSGENNGLRIAPINSAAIGVLNATMHQEAQDAKDAQAFAAASPAPQPQTAPSLQADDPEYSYLTIICMWSAAAKLDIPGPILRSVLLRRIREVFGVPEDAAIVLSEVTLVVGHRGNRAIGGGTVPAGEYLIDRRLSCGGSAIEGC
jgi:hypothetical protein